MMSAVCLSPFQAFINSSWWGSLVTADFCQKCLQVAKNAGNHLVLKNRFHYWRSPNNGWAGQRSLDPTHKNFQFLTLGALPKHVQTAVLFSLPTGRLQSYGLWSNTGRISQLNIIRMRIWEIVFEILPLFCLLQKINILLKITV